MFYPLLAFALFHLVRRKSAGDWRIILLYVHVVFAIILFFHPAWSTRFLLIPISLMLMEASAALARMRRSVKAFSIAACFLFALMSVYLQKETFSDFKRSALAVKNSYPDHRVISDEQTKTEYYLEKRIVPYEMDLELQNGDVLILHSHNTDLNAQKELLDARYFYRPLLSTHASIVPLLANTALAKTELTNSTNAVLQRFLKQEFQSVVVIIDRRK
jgi:hypothetical protein